MKETGKNWGFALVALIGSILLTSVFPVLIYFFGFTFLIVLIGFQLCKQ